MKKLSLDLEALAVDSFETGARRARVGTVRAHGETGFDPDSTAPCAAGTEAGGTCDTTCRQIICTCTQGGEPWQTCDNNCNTGPGGCW